MSVVRAPSPSSPRRYAPSAAALAKSGVRPARTAAARVNLCATSAFRSSFLPGSITAPRFRVAGEGQPGIGGGPRGDLFLVITVKPDALYERKGDDVYLDFEVDLVTAILGGVATIPLLDGRKVTLNIPPETQNGRVFRLAGKGMPRLRGEGNGNLFARLKAVLPMNLSEKERELFEELARIRGASFV